MGLLVTFFCCVGPSFGVPLANARAHDTLPKELLTMCEHPSSPPPSQGDDPRHKILVLDRN